MHVAVRAAVARPRLLLAMAVVALLPLALPPGWPLVTRLLCGWDVGILTYLALAFGEMAGADARRMREHADLMDDGAVATLVLTVLAAVASLVAIAAELAGLRDVPAGAKTLHIGLAGCTLLASWVFVHTVFAQHYAYQFYVEEECGEKPAFDFPGGTREPAFSDFLYVSFTIGASSATSDVNVISNAVRKVMTAHCVLSFFFNTSVLGFGINVGAGLLS
jgi:uncharacterized membrane protein